MDTHQNRKISRINQEEDCRFAYLWRPGCAAIDRDESTGVSWFVSLRLQKSNHYDFWTGSGRIRLYRVFMERFQGKRSPGILENPWVEACPSGGNPSGSHTNPLRPNASEAIYHFFMNHPMVGSIGNDVSPWRKIQRAISHPLQMFKIKSQG